MEDAIDEHVITNVTKAKDLTLQLMNQAILLL
jgi:hypothetical protein